MKRIRKSSETNYNKFREYFVFSCVDLLIFDNDSILLTKRTQNPHKGFWHLPGSIIRKNEKMRDAVKRAAKSELNLEVKILNYLGVYENLNDFRHDLSHAFVVSHTSGKIMTDFQSDELKFFKKIPKNTVPHHKKMIKDFYNQPKKSNNLKCN